MIDTIASKQYNLGLAPKSRDSGHAVWHDRAANSGVKWRIAMVLLMVSRVALAE